jgi:signal transduction histidine kinase
MPFRRSIIAWWSRFIRWLRTSKSERESFKAQLREAEKMEAIDRFAGGITHDFNNILGCILAYGEMLHKKAPEQSAQKRYAENVLAAANRGRALVDQIVAYRRSAIGEGESTDLACIVTEALDLLGASLATHIALDWRPPVSRLAVVADATQLHRIVMNLCSNAMHALQGGGILRVAITATDVSTAGTVSHGTLTAGRYACLTVEDSGGGMGEATLARIFEPFFTTKKAGIGSGLGLSVVRAIVTDLTGAIDVKSAVGRGSAFAVYLPLQQDVRMRS